MSLAGERPWRHESRLPSCSRSIGRVCDRWTDVIRVNLAHSAPPGPRHTTLAGQGPGGKSCTSSSSMRLRSCTSTPSYMTRRRFRHWSGVYALISRMRVLSSPAVIEKAEAVVRMIVDTYFAPNKTFPEVRKLMDSHAIDPLRSLQRGMPRRIAGSLSTRSTLPPASWHAGLPPPSTCIQRLSDKLFALHGAHPSSIVATLKGSSVDGSAQDRQVELNQGAARRNHNRIPRDQRAIDRGIPNRQIAPHQDFGGVRGEVFADHDRTHEDRPISGTEES